MTQLIIITTVFVITTIVGGFRLCDYLEDNETEKAKLLAYRVASIYIVLAAFLGVMIWA